MSNTEITVFNTLSSIYWKPVNFTILDEKINLNKNQILFTNGMKFNFYDFLKDGKDFSSNRKTSFLLTDLKNNKDFLNDNTIKKESNDLSVIKSPIYITDDNSKNLIIRRQKINNFNQLITSSEIIVDDVDVLNFVFNTDGYVSVIDYDGYYLTSTFENVPGGLTFQKKIIPENQAQQFDYFLGDNNIVLFEINDSDKTPRYRNAVTLFNTGVYGLSTITKMISSSVFPKQMVLDFVSYSKYNTKEQTIKDSFIVKYLTGLENNINDLKKDTSVTEMKYSQNYLGVFPSENFVESYNEMTFPIIFHGLKNYQTPEYNYTLGFNYLNNQQAVRRLYEKIHTGTNQTGGLNNVFLGFNSNTLKMEFKPDTTSYFYFPSTMDRVKLSDSGLIEDGSISGQIPYNSDRISIKNKNYLELIPDSNQPESIKNQSNTWLCSWLSGNIDGDKTWMSRYYNAAYYTIDQALSSKVILYNDKLDPTLNYTYDIESEMYLEPGVLYEYTRIGQKNRKTFINYLSNSSLLQITNWNSQSLKYDYKNDQYGLLYYNDINNLKGNYLNLDGNNHALFPATTELLESNKLTVSFWLNVNDWKKINGYQIFGNYFDGGYGLINDSSITTPIITIIDNYNNNIYNLNYKFSVLSKNNIPLFNKNESNGNDYQIIQRLNDFSYWIFDKKNISGIKYNINNDIIIKVDRQTISDLHPLKEITQIEIDSKEFIYIYDNKIKKCIVLNTFGKFERSVDLSSNTNRIEIDLNDQLLSLYGNSSVIDNYNNIWESVGSNLYKNKKFIANIGTVQYLTVDDNDNLWILHGQDSITKINVLDNKIYDGYPKRFGKNSRLAEDLRVDNRLRYRYLNFLRVRKDLNFKSCDTSNIDYEDQLVLVDLIDDAIYIMDDNLNIKIKLNISALTKSLKSKLVCDGDFTGYSFLRKFYSTQNKISWKIKISNVIGGDERLITLPFDLNSISEGWHHFCMTFDSETGVVTSYIDTIKKGEEFFEPKIFKINYKYRTSLLLGIQSLKNTTLNDIISINDNYKFIGKFSELRLYNKSLNRGEIEQLYYSSEWISDDRSLVWNMPIGTRSYIEEIKHWYKLQLPGSKSKYFNINIHNLDVNDDIKLLIKNAISNNIKKISPANTELYNINWI